MNSAEKSVGRVRAARDLLGDEAGTTVTIFGHSQGGHAALFADSLAAHRTSPRPITAQPAWTLVSVRGSRASRRYRASLLAAGHSRASLQC